MYEVYKETHFAGAHHLREYNGKCEAVHGHNWRVRAWIAAKELDHQGMVIDFKILKKALNDVVDILDHTDVNNVPPFDKLNPSAENIAKYIFDTLEKTMDNDSGRVRVARIQVWESEASCATYTPD